MVLAVTTRANLFSITFRMGSAVDTVVSATFFNVIIDLQKKNL